MRYEGEIRDNAKDVLGLTPQDGVLAGCDQIRTFNQLGFPGVMDKPDGWWLPEDTSRIALILEAKAESVDIDTKKCIDEIRKNCTIAMTRYDHVVGILYNGKMTRAFKNNIPIDVPDELQSKEYYFAKFSDSPIDKNLIYTLTARINNCLHNRFGM